MFGILLLLSLNTGQLQGKISTPPSNLDTLVSESQIIQSETCQKGKLRQFDLMELEGHRINKLLYLQTKSILKEARAKGFPMEINSTFRSCAEQVSLRKQNCGGDTSTLTAESCSPPTEKPGDSLHNYGMAVDFKCSDSPTFGNSSCYGWLKENASKYKLVQRAEEPWHWSFTGR